MAGIVVSVWGLPLKYRFGVTGHHHDDRRAVLMDGCPVSRPSWMPVVGRR